MDRTTDIVSCLPGILCILAIATTFLWYKVSKNNRRFPPGPKARFFVGNSFDLPTSFAARGFAAWSKTYNSDILYANAFGIDMIIINSAEIAHELFVKRSSIYNDRPDFPMVSMIGWDYNFGLLRYGRAWRAHRKMSQENFNPTAAKRYQGIQRTAIHKMLRSFLVDPGNFEAHINLMSISITLMMMYGYSVTSLTDPAIIPAEEGVLLGSALMGSTLGSAINSLPWLRHLLPFLPLNEFKKKIAYVKHLSWEMERIPMEYAKQAVIDGTSVPSLLSDLLEQKAVGEATDEEVLIARHVASTTYGAASDTVISAIMTMMHVFAKSPAVAQRAQDEIDRVVGPDRLPDFEDRPQLPYVEAIYREVLRFNPPLPAGVTHALMEDDLFEGYFLPKGAHVIGNIWAMTRDERKYPEPNVFKPERFFDANGKLNDDAHPVAFGFGRRVCVGEPVGSASTWMNVVSVLACFNIGIAINEVGDQAKLDEEYLDFGIMCRKAPFQCSITPRSERHRSLVIDTDTADVVI